MKVIVSDDGSATAWHEGYAESYHSRFGAVSESQLVYLDNSGLTARLTRGMPTRVLEIGFGLGLNCLLSAASARQCQTLLRYTSIEKALITQRDWAALNYAAVTQIAPECAPLQAMLSNPRENHCVMRDLNAFTQLTLHTTDATAFEFPDKAFDIVYQDAFSPSVNPELWRPAFLERLYPTLVPGGVLATYCVRGAVRRALDSAGFIVEKRPGPAGKREVLVARRAE
ncbi:MAG TPA: hypothetical protein DD979_15305 [Gammaproteobacteria bacterium]|jgi:tRNA U34 5-methylaminomethyl-2-thiouridine-forming methyltransferase MnmC|nr:hypothetical protein [Gammaproteobacteria bacterium]